MERENVISLTGYRCQRRKQFLTRYGTHLDHFISTFLSRHLDWNFFEMAYCYQTERYHNAETVWDYTDFREALREGLRSAVGVELFRQLKSQPWFDHRLLQKEEVLDRCLSVFILEQCQVAMLP